MMLQNDTFKRILTFSIHSRGIMSRLHARPDIYLHRPILVLEGEFNQYEADEDIQLLVQAYNEHCLARDSRDLLLEFRTSRIGTVGINVLTELYQVCREHDGELVLIGFPANEMRYLEITGFSRFVQLLDTRDNLGTLS
jgi:anti-anti-sigma regulatory factor